MPDLSAARAAALRWMCAIAASALLLGVVPASADWNKPWTDKDRALVIDAYEFNPINWKSLTSDKRIAGFISKASDGLPPEWSCGKLSGDLLNLCKNRWWKYSVTQELYLTRREMAKTLGLKWGAYHLGRPGNPREQADHFVDFAQPDEDDLIALDIEDNTDEWMSLADAEIFAQQIKIRLGRYPVLYTNGNTADFIARNQAEYPLLSRLPLWYARYRDDITGVFPAGNWDNYALWQFSSMHNCNSRSCPYRVAGAKADIDVNVSPLTVAELKDAWPFNDLVGKDPTDTPNAGALIASVSDAAKKAVSDVAETEIAEAAPSPAVPGTLAAAYGSSGRQPIDPLKLLTEAARQEHKGKPNAPVLSALTDAQKVNPPPPGDAPALKPTQATKLIDAVTQLKQEMQAVREILHDAQATGAPLEQRSEVRDHLKSRIAELMKKAQATVLSVPANHFIGPQRPDERAEVETGRDSWTSLASLAKPDRRVVKAFDTTR
ncbi:glycoside hydrolase family 25 protein [Aureimonas ureilytica]|uniref:glycoside hydrolase family 25 protein n=1 Tax=Aureimonas ureilytica TaxID=401562 RepID=UPI00039D13E1|nr:glycoside hydrolase family 25 protein [Aureimonas ureilytica]